jgi:transposase
LANPFESVSILRAAWNEVLAETVIQEITRSCWVMEHSDDMEQGSRMARLTFSEEDRKQLRRERFEHPHPRVQLRMEVLWLISCGESYSSAARLADVSDATVDRYVALYREHGIEGLKRFDWKGQTSELAVHQKSLEELFLADPPHTTAEACRRIEEVTGVKRGLTQVRRFLKKVSG